MDDTFGRIIVTLSSEERPYSFEDYNLNFNSPDQEIINALRPVFQEEGIALDEINEMYIVKRMESSGNVYIFPKSTAG